MGTTPIEDGESLLPEFFSISFFKFVQTIVYKGYRYLLYIEFDGTLNL